MWATSRKRGFTTNGALFARPPRVHSFTFYLLHTHAPWRSFYLDEEDRIRTGVQMDRLSLSELNFFPNGSESSD